MKTCHEKLKAALHDMMLRRHKREEVAWARRQKARVSTASQPSIPDLLALREVPAYVRKRTGVTVNVLQVSHWPIETFQLSRRGSQRFTTKRIIDEFIRQHVKQRVPAIRHRTYRQLADQAGGGGPTA